MRLTSLLVRLFDFLAQAAIDVVVDDKIHPLINKAVAVFEDMIGTDLQLGESAFLRAEIPAEIIHKAFPFFLGRRQ